MPLRHGLCRVSAFASIALRQPPAAALPIPRMLRPGKSIHGFSGDCRSASHFCMRKAALRGSLLIGKYERKIPPWIFSGLQKRFALLHVAKSPSMALYWLASTSEKIHPWIFRGLQKRFALLHVAKPPSMALYWLASTREKSIRGFFRVLGCPINSLHSFIPNSYDICQYHEFLIP